jgi:hypothetical protein
MQRVRAARRRLCRSARRPVAGRACWPCRPAQAVGGGLVADVEEALDGGRRGANGVKAATPPASHGAARQLRIDGSFSSRLRRRPLGQGQLWGAAARLAAGRAGLQGMSAHSHSARLRPCTCTHPGMRPAINASPRHVAATAAVSRSIWRDSAATQSHPPDACPANPRTQRSSRLRSVSLMRAHA